MSFRDLFVDDPDILTEEEVLSLSKSMADRIRSFCATKKDQSLREELERVADDLEMCNDIEDIDWNLDNMYNICDYYSIWVE